jgi:hypothetical protein
MAETVKAPSGQRIWQAIRDELMLNLYPLPFSTLAPTIYHVYLHPDDFAAIEGIAPRIVGEVQRALTAEVEKVNAGLQRSGRRVLTRLLERQDFPPIEVPPSGWEVHIQADRDGELEPGHFGIVSTLSMAAPAEYGGTPTTRIVKSVVGRGRRSSTTEVQPAAHTEPAPAAIPDTGERATLSYEDEQGPHVFIMRKDSLSVGRGGSSAWVDVQVVTTSKVSREHFRIRRDASGRFFIQDASLWGTSVDGKPVPPGVKTTEGVIEPGAEQELPPSASIGLADAVVIRFQAASQAPTAAHLQAMVRR